MFTVYCCFLLLSTKREMSGLWFTRDWFKYTRGMNFDEVLTSGVCCCGCWKLRDSSMLMLQYFPLEHLLSWQSFPNWYHLLDHQRHHPPPSTIIIIIIIIIPLHLIKGAWLGWCLAAFGGRGETNETKKTSGSWEALENPAFGFFLPWNELTFLQRSLGTYYAQFSKFHDLTLFIHLSRDIPQMWHFVNSFFPHLTAGFSALFRTKIQRPFFSRTPWRLE